MWVNCLLTLHLFKQICEEDICVLLFRILQSASLAKQLSVEKAQNCVCIQVNFENKNLRAVKSKIKPAVISSC